MFTSKSLTEPQKAYLAGFIDGEGYIGLTFQIKRETSQNSATPRHHPYLIIANNNSSVLFYVKELLGEGRIYKLQELGVVFDFFQSRGRANSSRVIACE